VTALETRPSLRVRVTPRLLSAAREIALLTSVFVLYELGRHVVREREGLAFSDAEAVLSLQRTLPLPSEAWLQGLMLNSEALTRAANIFYVSVHFPATIAFLVWMWVCRPKAYTWARSVLVSVTMVALLLHVTFPLAPPRMLPHEGFVDTMAVYGPSAYGEGTESVTNQFAAMPSLHVGWAVLVAVVCIQSGHSRRRWLWVLHPLITTLVVVVTANHYWLDGVVGALVIVGALWFLAPGREALDSPATVATAPIAVPASPAQVTAPVSNVPAPGPPLSEPVSHVPAPTPTHLSPEPLLPTQRRAPSTVASQSSQQLPQTSGAEPALRTGCP
jgi:hypothetical protein